MHMLQCNLHHPSLSWIESLCIPAGGWFICFTGFKQCIQMDVTQSIISCHKEGVMLRHKVTLCYIDWVPSKAAFCCSIKGLRLVGPGCCWCQEVPMDHSCWSLDPGNSWSDNRHQYFTNLINWILNKSWIKCFHLSFKSQLLTGSWWSANRHQFNGYFTHLNS